MLTSRHKKAPESFDSEALDHDYYIWVKNGNLRKLEIKMPDRHEGSGIIAEKFINHLCKV